MGFMVLMESLQLRARWPRKDLFFGLLEHLQGLAAPLFCTEFGRSISCLMASCWARIVRFSPSTNIIQGLYVETNYWFFPAKHAWLPGLVAVGCLIQETHFSRRREPPSNNLLGC